MTLKFYLKKMVSFSIIIYFDNLKKFCEAKIFYIA